MKAIANRSPYLVGLGGCAALLALALVIGILSTATFGQKDYTGYFEHTAGLRVSEDVQVAGVSVGEITGISLDGTKVKVEFTVSKDIKLGDATTAAVKVSTLLGTHFLEITPKGSGSLDADTVPMAQTTVPFNLQDVIEDAGTSLKSYDSEKISESFTVLADALRGTPEAAREALVGVSRLSKVAAQRSEQMRRLLSSARTVTGKLADNNKDLISVLEQSNQILEELVSRRNVIHAMLVDSERLAKAIKGVIDDNEARFKPLMKDLTTTLELLRKHEKGLADSINGLAYTSRYFANATGNGPWMDLHVPVVVPDNIACLSPAGGCE